MVHLRLLGGAALEDASGAALGGPAAHRHALGLLALLALAPGRTLTRGKLVGYLWPDAPEKAARNRLSTCVHRLRSVLGGEALLSHGKDLRLNDEFVACDLWRFRAALAADDPAAAVALYGGPFLDGFWISGSPEFDRWLDLERDRVRREYRDALESLAAEAEAAGEPAAAARWWRERARNDPFDGRVAARLMEALAAAGNRVEALRVADRHARALEEELGTGPDAEVERLRERLRKGAREGHRGEPHPGSLAVLPFEQSGPDCASTSAFADGLHQDLLSRLARIAGLRVISRTSVLRYGGGSATIGEIARDLGVGAVVEGGVQHGEGRVRLNVQLIDVGGDAHRWAETYDRELTADNLFDIQSELAEKITGILRSELTPNERERVMDWRPTLDLEAYRLHAQGRSRLDARTEEGMRHALEHFEGALARDNAYALAWVGLADTLTLLHEYGYEPAEGALPRAEEALQRAVELDEDLAEAHASLGLLHEARHEGPAAIRELERAVELQPGYAEAHNWLSWTHQLLGRADRGLDSARRAVELDPLSAEAVTNLSLSSLAQGDHETALREARRSGELQPGWNSTRFCEALGLFHLERYAEAGELLRGLAVPWAGRGPEATLALVYAATGDRERAREMRGELEADGEVFAAGLIHAALDRTDEAWATFGRVERWSYWETLAVHHHYPRVLDPLRRDSRYEDLLGRVRVAWGLEVEA